MEKEIEIKEADTTGKDELYCNWWDCPNCENHNVTYGSNFCSDCGVKFKWIKS